nr:4-hydroxythreonine-4-phosphate dehydrogenase PdxA [Kordiimonas gwangyangensis]
MIARLWREREAIGLPPFVYVGAPEALHAVDADLPITRIERASDADSIFAKSLPVLPVSIAEAVVPGTLNPANGAAVVEAIDTAVSLALDGDVSAVVTAPIHKAALYQVGFSAPGHTEYLARRCGLDDKASVMMLATDELRVIPVTIHVALKDVPKHLTAGAITHAGMVAAHDLRGRFGITKPRIAIAALNLTRVKAVPWAWKKAHISCRPSGLCAMKGLMSLILSPPIRCFMPTRAKNTMWCCACITIRHLSRSRHWISGAA